MTDSRVEKDGGALKGSEEPDHDLIGLVDDFLFFDVLRLSVWRMDQVAAVFVVKIPFPELQRSQYYKHDASKPSEVDRIELVGWGLLEYEMMEWQLVEDCHIQDTGMSNSDLAE